MTSKGKILGLSFILSFGLVVAAGYYRSSISEGAFFYLTLPQKSQVAGKPVIADLAGEGLPKKIFQPEVVRISTHGIQNRGKKAYHLQFELSDNTIPVTWSVLDQAWDEKSRLLARPFQPGESLGVGLLFKVPEDSRGQSLIYEGKLRVIDYQTKEQLASIPIKITNTDIKTGLNMNTKASPNASEDCCTVE